MTPESQPQHLSMAGHLAGAIVVVAMVLVLFAGSLGLVVLVWRWMVTIVRGGCA